MEEQHAILSVIISAQKSESTLINLDLTGIISLWSNCVADNKRT